ncbi:MAG: tRNA pseudouridine(55) synthase TruB [Oscillospiraceae bacterium]|nr:tRNA pseudouridine(55) synthase TruB [Oscillospiraceae bacterium]
MDSRSDIEMTGVFAVDKPQGFTSFDVVAKLRGILKIRKIGHGGTLDPMATGVLPIFTGKATKAVNLLPDKTKRYVATARFGLKTDTGDITGKVIDRSGVQPAGEALEGTLAQFLGKGLQIPPMYSAIRVDGKRLYELARKGEIVVRKPREVEFFSICLLDYDFDKKEFTIDVCCSAGSYIRTLVEDIAGNMGALSTLTALRRVADGPFQENDCIELPVVEQRVLKGDYDFIQSVDKLFFGYRRIRLSVEQERAFVSGASINSGHSLDEGEAVRIYGDAGFIALAKNDRGRLKATTRFI